MEMNHVTYISAGAGSGKTYTLTTFLSELITKKGVKPKEFILTTFTEAAAAEFKEKARAKIFECTDYEQYAQAAERLNQAMIGTVDSMSYRFVMKYWYLLGISPNLKLLDDETRDFFINQNLESLLTEEEILFLNTFVDDFEIGYSYGSDKYGKNYDFWKEDVKDIMDKSKSFDTDMSENLKSSLEYADSLLGSYPLSYNKNDTKDIFALLDEFDAVNAQSSEGEQRSKRNKAIKDWRHKFSNGAGYLTYQGLANVQKRPPLAGYKDCSHYQSVMTSLSHIYDSQEVKDKILKYIRTIFDVVNRLTKKYQDYKREQHAVDYVDIENHFLTLLDNGEVKADIRENFKYVFVDEFQDSSPTQVKMFEKLSAIVGRDEDDDYKIKIGENTFSLHNSVWVGDFKQAIYGFRGADTALTKAVADIIEANMKIKPKQFSMHSLDTSYRSYQQIVDKTNEIFEHSFRDILSPENVHLNYHRAQPGNFDSLRIWTPVGENDAERSIDLCNRLEKLVLKTKDPSKIAVLARKSNDYKKVVDELRKRNIPVSIETEIETSCDEVQLIISLLRLVINPYDAYSRALVTFLTEKDFDVGKIIDSKLVYNDEFKKAKDSGKETLPEYLSDKPIVSKFLEKSSVFSSQTIHSLVESLIIELDLFNLCRNWKSAENSDVILQALIDAAGKYEELCDASAIPPTISGYIAYISDKENLKSGGSKNGIVFMTIHKSKGLEWDHVILLSLKSDESKTDQFMKHEVFGVSFYHKESPSSDNLYPAMILNLFPGIITGSYGVPQYIVDSVKLRSSRYEQQLNDLKSEVRRLWYVAITRARDILTLVQEEGRGITPYAALNLIGVPSGWEAGFIEDDDNLKDGEKYELTTPPVLSLKVQESKARAKRNIQPSGYSAEKKFTPKAVYKSGDRIVFGKGESESNIIGSCIHDIFCVLETNKTLEACERIIEGYELNDVLNDSAAIIKAWDNLAAFLKKEYGEPVSVAHELSFTQGFDGHIVNGSIDYIYRTSKGTVLIDFKTFPGKESDILNEGKHCAANYSGQFQCYQKALEANGETVIAKLVYYPVGGLVVELN